MNRVLLVLAVCALVSAHALPAIWGALEFRPAEYSATKMLSSLVQTNLENLDAALKEDFMGQGRAQAVVVPEYALVADDYFDVGKEKAHVGRAVTRLLNLVKSTVLAVKEKNYELGQWDCGGPTDRGLGESNVQSLANLPCLVMRPQQDASATAINPYLFVNLLTAPDSKLGGLRGVRNTEFVFEPDSGKMLLAYHKQHPIVAEKPILIPGTEDGVVQTRFGAVATMICFDALFAEVHELAASGKVHTFVWSTKWASLGPLHPIAVASGFSRLFGVHIISATLNVPEDAENHRHTGSGIFSGGRALVYHSVHPLQDAKPYKMLKAEIDAAVKPPFAFAGDTIHGADIQKAQPIPIPAAIRTTRQIVTYHLNGKAVTTNPHHRQLVAGEELVIETDDLHGHQCVLKLTPTEVDPDNRYIFQIIHGHMGGRYVISCAFFLVCDTCTEPRQFGKYTNTAKTKFSAVSIFAAHIIAKNIAVLPLSATAGTDGKGIVPLNPDHDTSTFVKGASGNTEAAANSALFTTSPRDQFVTMHAIYGVYDERPTATIPSDAVLAVDGDEVLMTRQLSDPNLQQHLDEDTDAGAGPSSVPSPEAAEPDSGAGVGSPLLAKQNAGTKGKRSPG